MNTIHLETTSAPELQKLNVILERTMEQALRAGEIIRHLREFVSKGDDRRENVRMDPLVEDTIAFLRWEFRNEKIALEYQPGCDNREILANKVQIEQVLVNLMRVSGIGGEYSELLKVSGVDTIKELRHRKADNLAEKMKQVNDEKKLTRTVPSESQVSKRIEQAKSLEPLISH